MNECGLILLAAGNSSRLGQPKQLLEFRNKSLFQHSLEVSTKSGTAPVIVVYGANTHILEHQASFPNAHFVYNTNWDTGIASSVKTGLACLLKLYPGIGSVIFMVCDQPYVSPSILNTLIQRQYETRQNIIVSLYENNYGSPALFTKHCFSKLLELQGNEGAKKMIKENIFDVATISFPMGHIDIDTREDYELLCILDKK